MSRGASSQNDSSTTCGCLFLILLLVAAGYSGVRYWLDSTAYQAAHAAYLQADCKTAIEQYQKVVDAFHLIDFGSLKAKSNEREGDYNGAVSLYDYFLADFPSHPSAAQVKESLAKAIIAGAKKSGAGTLPDPTRSGAATGGTSVIVVHNDAPVRLRIAISGPETRVEEIEACATCQKYGSIGPLTCPNKGPVARYTVKPGEYAVVVQSISDGKVTPFSGTWKLTSGQEYSSCFYIVTRTVP